MNKIYADFGITVMDSNGKRKTGSLIHKELLESIDKQIRWEEDRS